MTHSLIKAHVQDLCIVLCFLFSHRKKVLNVLLSSFHFFIKRDNAKVGQLSCLFFFVVALIDCVFALPLHNRLVSRQ